MKRFLTGLFIGVGLIAGTAYGAQVLSGPQGGTGYGYGNIAASSSMLLSTGLGTWVLYSTSTLGINGAGTVTSVSGSGGTTGLTLTGGAITTTGTLTLGGVLIGVNGGTGLSTTASSSILFGNASNGYVMMATSSLGLKTSAFLSPNISQWTNDSSYLTTVDISANTNLAATYPITLTGDTLGFTATSTFIVGALTANTSLTLPLITDSLLWTNGSGVLAATTTGLVSAGTGISVTASRYVLGGALTITNDGVTSISATSPLVNNVSVGAVSLTCPTCSTFTYPFPSAATTTLLAFNGGLTTTNASSSASFYSNLLQALDFRATNITATSGITFADGYKQTRGSNDFGTTDTNATTTDIFTMRSFDHAVTIQNISGVIDCPNGCVTVPSGITVKFWHGTNRSASTTATALFTVNPTFTSTTTLQTFNSGFNDATLAANEILWYQIVAASTTQMSIDFTGVYTND